MSRVSNVSRSAKTLAFLAVAAMAAGAVLLLSFVYRPRGTEALKARLAETRARAMTLDKERERLRAQTEALQRALAEEGEASAVENSDRTNVTIEVVAPRLFRDVLTLPGVVEAYDDILLAAKQDGTVEWIGPREGQRLKKGEPIAKIDAEALIPRLRAAEAAENLALANFRRIEKLAGQKVTSPEELDRARSELEQARAAAAIARKSYEDATLYSPIDGVADQLLSDVGEFVNRGQTVARLVDVSTVKINLNVPEKDVSFLRVGRTARVRLPQPFEGETTGTIARIALVADPASKTFPVEVSVANPDGALRPGMIAKTELVRRERPDAIAVSFFTVMQTGEGAIVFVENEGHARMRAVKVGARQGMTVEVTEGLEAGDRLIVEGQRMVSDGTPVRVVKKTEPGVSLQEVQP